MTSTERHYAARRRYFEALADSLEPAAAISLSGWAEKKRWLSPKASSQPGPWRNAGMPFLVEPMDCVTDPLCGELTIMKSNQVGATELILNAIGYHAEHKPTSILYILPTLVVAEGVSKRRVQPMFDASPDLHGILKDVRTRDSGNTLLEKDFANGSLRIGGSNSPASLSSDPCEIVAVDEWDRCAIDAGDEGDPAELARGRQENYPNRMFIGVSTPTDEDTSRINAAFQRSSKAQYYVPCPHCGESHVLKFANVHAPEWEAGASLTDAAPDDCRYYCPDCKKPWSQRERWFGVRNGSWIHEHPERLHKGYHITGLMSPFREVPRMVEAWQRAQGSRERLKTFINLQLGECWKRDDDENVNPDVLYKHRRSMFGATLPAECMYITLGVDTNNDYLSYEIVGWSPGYESWSLEYGDLYGDPSAISDKGTWGALDEILRRTWPHENGHRIKISATCVDSGGHHTDMVYRYCRPRFRMNVFAIRGKGGLGTPIHPGKYSSKNQYKCRVWSIGVDGLKDELHGRLLLDTPGPGYCHFPMERELPYFEMLCAERSEVRWRGGKKQIVWVNPRQARNEPLDVRNYASFALRLRPPRWEALDRALNSGETNDQIRRQPKRNWVTQWR